MKINVTTQFFFKHFLNVPFQALLKNTIWLVNRNPFMSNRAHYLISSCCGSWKLRLLIKAIIWKHPEKQNVLGTWNNEIYNLWESHSFLMTHSKPSFNICFQGHNLHPCNSFALMLLCTLSYIFFMLWH